MAQSVMVGKENKLPMDEIVTPVLNSLHNRVKLNIVSAVTSTRACKFLTVKRHWSPVLAKYSPNAELRGVAMKLESGREIR